MLLGDCSFWWKRLTIEKIVFFFHIFCWGNYFFRYLWWWKCPSLCAESLKLTLVRRLIVACFLSLSYSLSIPFSHLYFMICLSHSILSSLFHYLSLKVSHLYFIICVSLSFFVSVSPFLFLSRLFSVSLLLPLLSLSKSISPFLSHVSFSVSLFHSLSFSPLCFFVSPVLFLFCLPPCLPFILCLPIYFSLCLFRCLLLALHPQIK